VAKQRITPEMGARRKDGCLFTLFKLTLVMGLVGAVMLATLGVFAPWAFYLGGHFHWLPMWRGVARMHSNAAGGDYVLSVFMWPTPGGNHMLPASNLGGNAWLCTPKGERFYMKLGGTMRRGLGTDLNGEKIHLYLHQYRHAFRATADYRPEVEFYGEWKGEEIEADDHRSIAIAFLPNGAVYRPGKTPRPRIENELVQATFVEASESEFEGACAKQR
jgi:hypothetical protein